MNTLVNEMYEWIIVAFSFFFSFMLFFRFCNVVKYTWKLKFHIWTAKQHSTPLPARTHTFRHIMYVYLLWKIKRKWNYYAFTIIVMQCIILQAFYQLFTHNNTLACLELHVRDTMLHLMVNKAWKALDLICTWLGGTSNINHNLNGRIIINNSWFESNVLSIGGHWA